MTRDADHEVGGAPPALQGALPPIPNVAWIVRVLVPEQGIWRAEKRIRAIDTLPARGDAFRLENDAEGRVEGVRSPAMSGVHADVYVRTGEPAADAVDVMRAEDPSART